MRMFTSIDEIGAASIERSAVAIGKFDGVHLGHQAILDRLREVAQAEGLDSVVFTFRENPLSLLRPERCPAPLMSPAQREAALAEAGVDICVMVPFDERLSSVPAESFVRDILVGRIGTRHVIVGPDFRFGHRGTGDVALLRRMGAELGFTVEEVSFVVDDDLGRVSSTRVREAIGQGDIELATRMLGRPVALRGEVVRGDARGRELGFPTANLGGDIEGFVPVDGVYAGWATVDGVRRMAAISVGSNPTFTPEAQSRVEAFLLDYSGDLYGAQITIEFVHRIRGTYTFSGVEALVERMHEDVRQTRALLDGGNLRDEC